MQFKRFIINFTAVIIAFCAVFFDQVETQTTNNYYGISSTTTTSLTNRPKPSSDESVRSSRNRFLGQNFNGRSRNDEASLGELDNYSDRYNGIRKGITGIATQFLGGFGGRLNLNNNAENDDKKTKFNLEEENKSLPQLGSGGQEFHFEGSYRQRFGGQRRRWKESAWSSQRLDRFGKLTNNLDVINSENAQLFEQEFEKFINLSGIPVSRDRRQLATKAICLGSNFLTNFMNTIIQQWKARIKDLEPIELGDSENLGIFVLKNARAYNFHTVYLEGYVGVDCTSNTRLLFIEFPVGVRHTHILFDWYYPFVNIRGGLLDVYFNTLFGNATLMVPRSRDDGFKTTITDTLILDTEDFKLTFYGLGPITGLLGSGLTVFYRIIPQVLFELIAYVLENLFKQYIDERLDLPLN